MTKKIKFTKTKKITIIKNSKGEVVSVNYIYYQLLIQDSVNKKRDNISYPLIIYYLFLIRKKQISLG